MNDDVSRELARQHHRWVAQYALAALVVQRLDCVVLPASELRSALGLSRLEGSRLGWLVADFGAWFSCVDARTGHDGTFLGLALSLTPLPEGRIMRMAGHAPRFGGEIGSESPSRVDAFSLPSPCEEKLLPLLLAWAVGVRAPEPRDFRECPYEEPPRAIRR